MQRLEEAVRLTASKLEVLRADGEDLGSGRARVAAAPPASIAIRVIQLDASAAPSVGLELSRIVRQCRGRELSAANGDDMFFVAARRGAGFQVGVVASPLRLDPRSAELLLERVTCLYLGGTPFGVGGEHGYGLMAEALNSLLDVKDGWAGREFWRSLPPTSFDRLSDFRLDSRRNLLLAVTGSCALEVVELGRGSGSWPRCGAGKEDLCLGAWILTASMMLGRKPLTAGLCSDGRSHEAAKRVLGPMWRVLPMCCRLDDDETASGFLRGVVEQRMAMLEWEDFFSWNRIEDGGKSCGDLFCPVTFSFAERDSAREPGTPAGRRSQAASSPEPCRFHLHCESVGGRIEARIFGGGPPTRAMWARCFREVLISLAEGVADESLRLRQVAARAAAPGGVYAQAPHPSSSSSIMDALSMRVAEFPDRIAVVIGAESVTFGELDRRARAIAGGLRGLGVGLDDVVGVCMERSTLMVAAILAVLKCGAAFAPFDQALPTGRLRAMAEDARVSITLVGAEQVPSASELGGRVVRAEDLLASRMCSENSGGRALAESLAYVIFTSGTTGRPKGAMIPHGALANHMEWFLGAFPLGEHDIVLQKTPLSFDASVWEFFAPMLAGCRLLLAPPGAQRDTGALVELIRRHQATVVQFVPSQFRLMAREGRLEECSGLSTVFCGGEALPWDSVRAFRRRHPASLVNLYGPTEAAIDSLFHRVGQGDGNGTVQIGIPIANVEARVLDSGLFAVPAGTPGELFLGGTCLARGYAASAAQTAASFIPNLFGRGGRLYRTGDRVRVRHDGGFEFLGRADQQVKFSGLRIELLEIENALASHPAVASCAAVVSDDPAAPVLAAFYESLPGSRPQEPDLRRHLRSLVPAHACPALLVRVDALPRLSNGKTDRRMLLQAPFWPDGRVPGETPPLTGVELRIAELWRELLHRDGFDAHSNFFELGGHSLTATFLLFRLREEFRIDLPLELIFEHPTIRRLGQRIALLTAPLNPVAMEPSEGVETGFL